MPISAVVDCERLSAAWPAQPVNTASAAGIVAVGILLVALATPPHRWYGIIVMLTGAGSIAFHGDLSPLTEGLHDWSLALLAGAFALATGSTARAATSHLVALGGALGVALGVAPDSAEILTLILALTAVVRELPVLATRHRGPLFVAGLLASTGAAASFLGRTGGALCAPSSVLQPHAVWHLLGALALAAYALSRGWLAGGRDRVAG